MSQQPVLVIFAGPNGSGKSSMIKEAMSRGLLPAHYINADDMTKQSLGKRELHKLSLDEINRANAAAATLADQLRQEAVLQGKSFTTETVLSTDAKINLMRQAKESGYLVHLWYVLTQNPVINIHRVQDRVAKGGHDVPEEKIRLRFERAMELLPIAIAAADAAIVADNSAERPVIIKTKAAPFLPSPILHEIFDAVGRKAIAETHSAGRPSFHGDKSGLFRLYPDGTRVNHQRR